MTSDFLSELHSASHTANQLLSVQRTVAETLRFISLQRRCAAYILWKEINNALEFRGVEFTFYQPSLAMVSSFSAIFKHLKEGPEDTCYLPFMKKDTQTLSNLLNQKSKLVASGSSLSPFSPKPLKTSYSLPSTCLSPFPSTFFSTGLKVTLRNILDNEHCGGLTNPLAHPLPKPKLSRLQLPQ